MKKTTLIAIVSTSIFILGCKKKYTCECGNPGGIYKTFTIKDTRKNAVEKCYDKDQNIPFSETYCNLK